MERRPLTAGIFGGIFATLLVVVVVWLGVAYSGAYNVAATDKHADAVRWTLETTMRRSVSSRADDVDLPEITEEFIAEGADRYSESCVQCHGAPGKEPAGWSRGMRPEPPHLVEAATEWSTEEIYWIAENGIKMSGMPAFGPQRGPEEIAAIAAFVSGLPGLTPEDYAELTGGGHGHHDGAATVE
ncbi:c-type cytochrome [Palleronia sp.]|uniref:c-type cytochrome n=1 Tax=Palleronia sp. TaxID=1940284 RepID=UPI0035C7A034